MFVGGGARLKITVILYLQRQGRDNVAPYFTRYAEETKWRYAPGVFEGQPAMVFDSTKPMAQPAHFVLIDWRDGRVAGIRDFLFASYVLEATDWVRLTSGRSATCRPNSLARRVLGYLIVGS
jgi:RNA polymerase sigma-70 factor (ECF subfamily)